MNICIRDSITQIVLTLLAFIGLQIFTKNINFLVDGFSLVWGIILSI